MKIAWDNLVSISNISMLYGQRLLGGVPNHLLKDDDVQDGGMKFSLYCAKLSSALVARIKNDHSQKEVEEIST